MCKGLYWLWLQHRLWRVKGNVKPVGWNFLWDIPPSPQSVIRELLVVGSKYSLKAVAL